MNTRHKVVVTTNFDHLVADSLFMYCRKHPLTVGHESLASYVSTNPTRPLVCKIHRDLFLGPMNTPTATNNLAGEWKPALESLFREYTPIFIGYGGNDGSLMGLLEKIPFSKGDNAAPLWCHLENDPPPDDSRVAEFISKANGRFVKIAGFDELMYAIQHEQKSRTDVDPPVVRDLSEYLKSAGATLAKDYKNSLDNHGKRLAEEQFAREQFAGEQKKSDGESELKKAAAQVVEDEGTGAGAVPDPPPAAQVVEDEEKARQNELEKPSWLYLLRAMIAEDPDKKEEILNEGIKRFPKDSILLGNYADFLWQVRRDHGRAQELYERAIEADPRNVINLGNCATFLWQVRGDHGRIQELYERAIEADPRNVINLGNHATFLWQVRGDHGRIQELYERAIEADPRNAINLGNHANFLWQFHGDHDRAQKLYERAIEADPRNAINLGNYAAFLWQVRGDHNRAQELYERAIKADPRNANHLGNYAHFLTDIRGDHGRIQELFERAIEADPKHAINLGNYATFLWEVRGDHSRAQELYERAIEADPRNLNNHVNWCAFLIGSGRWTEAPHALRNTERLLAESVNQNHAEFWLYAALLLEHHRQDATLPLNWLRFAIAKGYQRVASWSFDRVFAGVLPNLPESSQSFYRALGAAILDEQFCPALEAHPRWQAIAPKEWRVGASVFSPDDPLLLESANLVSTQER